MSLIVGSFIYRTNAEYISFANRLKKNNIHDVRINCSNFDSKRIIQHVKMLKETFAKINHNINIFLDIPFPGEKIRISCKKDYFEFLKGHVYSISCIKDKYDTDLYIDDDSIIEYVSKNELIYIDDGKYVFKLKEIKEKVIYIEATSDGKVLGNKAIYIENLTFSKHSLENSSIYNELTELIKGIEPEYLILSFCEDIDDIISMKSLLKKIQVRLDIIPKIETIKGVKNLMNFFPYVNTIMLGRGDLGSTKEGLLSLGRLQEYFIRECKKNNKTIIIATDILNSLGKENYFPTRAEVLDLYYLLLQKVDYIFASAQIANIDKALNIFCYLYDHMILEDKWYK